MIDKIRILDVVRERLGGLPVGHYLELRTYKRNRSVLIVKRGEDDLLVLQRGYDEARYEVPPQKLPKLLKGLLKKEFPRSHKVRLYTPGVFDEVTALSTDRKIL